MPGKAGTAVALDPGGFWKGWERYFFYATLAPSIRLVRLLQPVMDRLMSSAVGRTLLLAQLSARPWDLSADVAQEEMRTFAELPSFDELLRGLAFGPAQRGTDDPAEPIVIGWGRKDRMTLPGQAKRALERSPSAHLHWFEDSGHYPLWDVPTETTDLILSSTATDE